MAPHDHVFRVSFRFNSKHYELIAICAKASDRAEGFGLPADAQIIRIEDFGLRSEMDDTDFERLRQEAAEWNEWSGRL